MRYFFHVHDGVEIRDEDGHELPSLDAAKIEAVKVAADMLRDEAETFWTGQEWRLEVADEAGTILFALSFTASVPVTAAIR